jgi:hypothetical protein
VGHSLLHQVLVSDLVVPVMLAEAPEQRSLTQFGARLSERTLLRPDLVVARREQFQLEPGHVTGTPQLVVEVASEASIERDLGAKRELWARFGLPAYWVVHFDDEDLRVSVFELDDGELVERAWLTWGDSYWATEPFKIEVSPGAFFETLPRTLAATRRGTMPKQSGPDLPPADREIEVDVFAARWPTAAEKVELEDGCPVFYGTWDERDLEIAERAYPGREVRLDQPEGEPGTLRVMPSPEGDETEVTGSTARRAPSIIKINVPGE